jgi:predicted ATPase/DNA-binding SARP family transcriptional activator
VPEPDTPLLVLRLFGPFEALLDGALLPGLRRRQARWLLALLALRAGRPVERVWLAGLLWPEAAEITALKNLRSSLADLRQSLGPAAGCLVSPTARTLCLGLGGAEVDVVSFDAAIVEGSNAGLERAVALYRGPLIEGCSEEWAFQERQAREQAYLAALELLAARALARGETRAAERHLRRAVSADPLLESAQRALMQTLVDQGRFAAAILTYRELRRRLHRELNAEPDPETAALFQQLCAEARQKSVTRDQESGAGRNSGAAPDRPVELPSLDARRHNLPAQPTRLIGREREVETVRDLLQRDDVRLLTLTGAGGSGKTHLGLHVAAEVLDQFLHGVYFTSLASISDPDLVGPAIAMVLGVRETGNRSLPEDLQAFLRTRQMLLLVDNFEHVLAAAPLVAGLLSNCPRLKVLVTSRAPLHLRGEQEFPVMPLAVPELRSMPPVEILSRCASVELFVQRARRVRPDFALTEANASAVAEVCTRLDGLPLAIEPAAAQIKVLPPEALLSRLESRLELLTGGARDLPAPQQTLRDAITWSYDLLCDGEKTLFRRLSVFIGGCTLNAAEAVGSAAGDLRIMALEGVASLVDKNLLKQEAVDSREPRFGMLETIREYALEQLAESGEEAEIRELHAQFFVELAEAAWPGEGEMGFLWGPDQKEGFDRLERENDNLRAALAWSQAASGRAETGLRLIASLGPFWGNRNNWSEVRALWESALARDEALGPRAARARASALRPAAMVGSRGDRAVQRARFEEMLALSRELGFREGVAWALQGLGHMERGNFEAAQAFYLESLAIFREIGHNAGVAHLLECLASISLSQGDYSTARALSEESVVFSRRTKRKDRIAYALYGLASVAQAQGEYSTAEAFFEEALVRIREFGHQKWMQSDICRGYGHLLLELGDYAAARSCFEEMLAIQRAGEQVGQTAWPLLEVAHAEWCQGASSVAQTHAVVALALFREKDDRDGILAALESMAMVALAQGRKERAARLIAATEALRETLGLPGRKWWLRPRERMAEAVRTASLDQELAAAWAKGRAMSLEEAIRFALA